MAVPPYEAFMLPLLKLAADGREHRVVDVVEPLAAQMQISEEDQGLLLPSGTQTRLYNRVSWAVFFLTKGLLLEKPTRGRFRLTARGSEVLRTNLTKLDSKYLERFPEFRASLSKRVGSGEGASVVDATDDTKENEATPDERLDGAYKELRETLADELLARVRSGTPKFFEHLVVDVLFAMGYGGSRADAAQVVGKRGDGGIDGVIKEDKLGLDMVYVQAKRYTSDVGPAAIREFVGSLGEQRANKGVFITCGGFTSAAYDAASKAHSRIVLIDGDQLAEFMIDHGVGVADQKSYTVKKLDSDYFDEA